MAFHYVPIAIVLLLTFRQAKADIYYVVPEVADFSVNASYNTLNYYANSTTLQLTDCVFYFMPGTHLLQHTWVINNASNLTLTGIIPFSQQDEEPTIQCTNNTVDGIHVINCTHIALEYIQLFHYQQDSGVAHEIWPTNLFFNSTTNLVLSNLTSGFTKGICLYLIHCTDYVIADSTFTNSHFGIFIEGFSSGRLSSIKVFNNSHGIHAQGYSWNLTTSLEIDTIYASSNLYNDFLFFVCSLNISLRNALFTESRDVFLAYQVCGFSETYAIQMQKCSFRALHEYGFHIHFSSARSLQIEMSFCTVSNSTLSAFYPIISMSSSQRFFLSKKNNSPKLSIQNVIIENTRATGNKYQTHVLDLSSIQSIEITDITIVNNTLGGLRMYDSIAVFRGTNLFRSNIAIDGGGMALYGNSFVFVKSNSTLGFIDNAADNFGGAIYVSKDRPRKDQLCFMQLDDFSPNIIFQDNTAGYTGAELYGGDVDTCQQIQRDLNLTAVLGLYTSTSQCASLRTDVSSEAKQLAVCEHHCVNVTKKEEIVSVFSGQKIRVRVTAVGQLNSLTQAKVDLKYDELFHYDKNDTTEFLNLTCANIARDIHAKRTGTWGNITFTISNNLFSRFDQLLFTIVVNVLPCPPGFMFSEQENECTCSEIVKKHAQCDITDLTISRNGTSWISPTDDSITIVTHCPFDYCNNEPFSVRDPDGQCDNNRSGILCGDCAEEFSLILGSNECKPCRDEKWQLPLIILGSVIAGIGLVAVVIELNLTISLGTLNGLLFSMNIVKIYESTIFHKCKCPFWRYIISWLNLDLGIPTCFFDGMNACQKVGLQFAFPLYLLFLVLLIIAFCRCGQWIVLRSLPLIVRISDKATLLMGSKIIPVLATLIVFSYTKLIQNVILIFLEEDITLFECNTSNSDCTTKKCWYVNGSVEYLTGCHHTLFLLGTGIVVPLILIFTIFLLFFPLMERYLPQFQYWSSWHMRLKPWYDAYGGPYKDKYRFWTGLLLLVRCFLVLVVTIDNDANVSHDILMWISLILIFLVGLLQVYKSYILNMLEIACLLCILAMAYPTTAGNSAQLYLVFSILLCLLIGIVFFHMQQRLRSTQLLMFLQQTIITIKKKSSNQVSLVNETEDDESKGLTNSVITTEVFDELREPLIEDSII